MGFEALGGAQLSRISKNELFRPTEYGVTFPEYGVTFPMDSDRKYRQHGYMDSDRDSKGPPEERPKPQGPRPPIDVTGPRLPRLVQHVAASRCFNCATTLPPGTDFNGACPKCNAELHCCKQCSHFEPSTRFQCLKPIPVRIASKDKTNECN